MTQCEVIIPESFIDPLNFYSYTVDRSGVTQSDREGKKNPAINSTFSPASVRHTQVLCLSLVEHQPSNHLLSSPLSPHGFLQLAGTIRHTDTVQRSAR